MCPWCALRQGQTLLVGGCPETTPAATSGPEVRRHKLENTVTICEIRGASWVTLSAAAREYAFCVGLGVLVGKGWVEDAAELGDEGKAAGCVPLAALLF
jgi:hypothetical protein